MIQIIEREGKPYLKLKITGQFTQDFINELKDIPVKRRSYDPVKCEWTFEKEFLGILENITVKYFEAPIFESWKKSGEVTYRNIKTGETNTQQVLF